MLQRLERKPWPLEIVRWLWVRVPKQRAPKMLLRLGRRHWPRVTVPWHSEATRKPRAPTQWPLGPVRWQQDRRRLATMHALAVAALPLAMAQMPEEHR